MPDGPQVERHVPGAVLLGWLMLGEVPPLIALPGGILCLAGVVLARWTPRRRASGIDAAAGNCDANRRSPHEPVSTST